MSQLLLDTFPQAVHTRKNSTFSFKVVFDVIRELMTPLKPKKKRPIGFAPCEKK